MKLIFAIVMGITLIAQTIISALAVMQAKRFHYISKRTQTITWLYVALSLILAISLIVSFFTIDFN